MVKDRQFVEMVTGMLERLVVLERMARSEPNGPLRVSLSLSLQEARQTLEYKLLAAYAMAVSEGYEQGRRSVFDEIREDVVRTARKSAKPKPRRRKKAPSAR